MKRPAALLIVISLFATNASAQSVRIATYNVNWGNGRGDALLDAIQTAKPDIICMQETTLQSEKFLREHLVKTHPHFYATGYRGRYAAERLTIASKTPLTGLSFVPPSAGLFGFYSANFRLGTNSVHLVSVHLTPFQIKPGGGISDAMAALFKTEETHAAEIAMITRAVDGKQPTIIVGDFNSTSTLNAPQALKRLGFVDAYAAVHPDADSHATWHWPTRPLPLALRVDYIFNTKHFVTKQATVVRRDGSDHSLVVAEFALANSQTPE